MDRWIIAGAFSLMIAIWTIQCLRSWRKLDREIAERDAGRAALREREGK